MKIAIKSRWAESILFEVEAAGIKAALELAVKGHADLRGAYLQGADLQGADLRGAYLRGAYLRGAYLRLVGSRPVLTIGPIGSRSDYLLGYCTDKGLYIKAGCWFGDGDAFEARVREVYPDGPHGAGYLDALTLLRGHEVRNRPVEQPTEVTA